MINVIFTISETEPLSDEIKLQMLNLGCSWVDTIPEMPRQDMVIPVQAIVPNYPLLQLIKAQLDQIDTRGAVEIIGIWNMDGTQYGYRRVVDVETGIETIERDESITIDYPFDSTKYLNYLRDINEYDQDGNIIGSHRPTLGEIFHINRYAGMLDREIT